MRKFHRDSCTGTSDAARDRYRLLLIELWNTRSTAAPLQSEWALATMTYNRIAAELTNPAGQGQTIRIVLDDGYPPETSD
ncbi:hypothetical protein [Streptomyces sp. DSM 110735]|uniref:hypothetical protein n=1 Tax=Streptomyces sp. DSM 110735 TaxID=2775031 RepID=UPI0018F27D6F|nr:hypothetical protein [Streptomyces sp. DSM 110735]MBJ7901742.1 hypothetical protein [Streptomyces sp. DSM 110735]